MTTESQKRPEVIDIDVRGQICPSTLIIAMDQINTHQESLRQGTVSLLIKTDDRNATVTIPEAATSMGYQVVVTREKGCYEIRISYPKL